MRNTPERRCELQQGEGGEEKGAQCGLWPMYNFRLAACGQTGSPECRTATCCAVAPMQPTEIGRSARPGRGCEGVLVEEV